jgi:hypothetical protein
MDLTSKTRGVEPDQIAGDRREDRRYTISLEVRYKLIRRRRVLDTGVGCTVDLSSGGILFEADRPLPVGLNLELSIEWPALLNDIAPMRLQVVGRIVRTENNRVALRTVQHEFRTQGGRLQTAEKAPGENNGRRIPVPSSVPQWYCSPAEGSFRRLQ